MHCRVGDLGALLRRLLIISVLATTTGCQAEAQPETLDALVRTQRYGDALKALHESGWDQTRQLEWLRRQAELGHVPLQYALSKRLFPGNLEESLKWYARSRLARTLDVAECADDSVSLSKRVMLDNLIEPVQKAGLDNPKLFNQAIAEAVDWDERRPAPPPAKWICGESKPPTPEGYVLPLPQRKEKREAARLTMAFKARMRVAEDQAIAAGRRVHYPVLDSGVPPSDGFYSDDKEFWLDNDRVVFLGHDVTRLGRNAMTGQPMPMVNTLYLWDTRSNKVEGLYRGKWVRALCLFRGYVRFELADEEDKQWVFEGPWGALKRRPLTDEDKQARIFDCKTPHAVPHPTRVFRSWRLLPEHGYLIGDYVNGKQWVRYYPPGNAEGIPVAFPDLNVHEGDIRYSERRNAYMVTGHYVGPGLTPDTTQHQWPPYGERFFYWFHPGGRIEKVSLPLRFCTKAGAEWETARGFLDGRCLAAPEGDRILNVEGWFRGPGSVSPDGCKVTFRYRGKQEKYQGQVDPRLLIHKPGHFTLKMIDLCQGGQ